MNRCTEDTTVLLSKNANSPQTPLVGRRGFLQTMAVASLAPLASFAQSGRGSREDASPANEGHWPADDDPNYWSWIRQQFTIPLDEAYFNTGTVGACPRPVQDAVGASMREMERALARYDYRAEQNEPIAGYRPEEALRAKAGRVLGASGRDIALTQNATMGLNFIANGLDLKPGDEVLLTDQEHPGALSPWELRAKRHGIVLKQLPIPIPTPNPRAVVKIFSDAIGPRTRVLAIPHITSRHGIVLPARELCALGRARGLFTLVDGAQAVGQLRVDVKTMDCDAYACSPHKWLLAPPGNGLLYVKAELQSEIWATLASSQWNNYTPANGVFRLMQFGTANAALLDGLDAAIDFHWRIGPKKMERRIIGLANQLRTGLQSIPGVTITSPLHPEMAGAMVTYSVAGLTGQQLQDELWTRKKYRVREAGGPLVRQSVHIYNNSSEIEETLATVRQLCRT